MLGKCDPPAKLNNCQKFPKSQTISAPIQLKEVFKM